MRLYLHGVEIMRRILALLAYLILILCFSATQNFAQTKIQSVDKIIISVGSDIILQVPINDKFPLLKGDNYRTETSNVDSMFQIDTSAVSKKIDEAVVTFRVTNQISREKYSFFNKRFSLKKGKKKNFKFKIKLSFEPQRSYSVTAYYESKEANNEQPPADN